MSYCHASFPRNTKRPGWSSLQYNSGTQQHQRFLAILLALIVVGTSQNAFADSCKCACTDDQAEKIQGCNSGKRVWELRFRENSCFLESGAKKSAGAAIQSGEYSAKEYDIFCRMGSEKACGSADRVRAATPVCMACCDSTTWTTNIIDDLGDIRNTLDVLENLPMFGGFQERMKVGDISMGYASEIAGIKNRVTSLKELIERILNGLFDGLGEAWYEAQVDSIRTDTHKLKTKIEAEVAAKEPPEWVPPKVPRVKNIINKARDISKQPNHAQRERAQQIVVEADSIMQNFNIGYWIAGEEYFEVKIADLERRLGVMVPPDWADEVLDKMRTMASKLDAPARNAKNSNRLAAQSLLDRLVSAQSELQFDWSKGESTWFKLLDAFEAESKRYIKPDWVDALTTRLDSIRSQMAVFAKSSNDTQTRIEADALLGQVRSASEKLTADWSSGEQVWLTTIDVLEGRARNFGPPRWVNDLLASLTTFAENPTTPSDYSSKAIQYHSELARDWSAGESDWKNRFADLRKNSPLSYLGRDASDCLQQTWSGRNHKNTSQWELPTRGSVHKNTCTQSIIWVYVWPHKPSRNGAVEHLCLASLIEPGNTVNYSVLEGENLLTLRIAVANMASVHVATRQSLANNIRYVICSEKGY